MDRAEPPFGQHHRAFHPGRPGADDEHRPVRARRRGELLGVPAAAVLLPRRRVLHAADLVERLLAQDADVGPGALADLVQPPLRDLAGQERVGDRLPGAADQVGLARGDHLRHQVRAGVAADRDDRLGRRLANPACPPALVPLRVVAGGPGVLRPAAHRHVPQVDQVVGHADQGQHVVGLDAGQGLGPGHAGVAVQRDPGRDRALAADLRPHRLQGFQPEPAPVGQAPAVAVGPQVHHRRQELGHQVAVRPVHVDDVESGVGRVPGRPHPVPLQARDVIGGHLLGQPAPLTFRNDLAWRHTHEPRGPVGGGRAAVVQLHTGQRAMRVDRLGGQPQRPGVGLVPDIRGDRRGVVGVGRYRPVLHANPAPAAFGLDGAERGLGPRPDRPEPARVRHLIEAVRQRLGADGHRLEQDRVPSVHRRPPEPPAPASPAPPAARRRRRGRSAP